MSITSAQGYEMRIARTGDKIADPPEPYRQTVERLLADRGVDHVAFLLAYALRDLDKAQGATGSNYFAFATTLISPLRAGCTL